MAVALSLNHRMGESVVCRPPLNLLRFSADDTDDTTDMDDTDDTTDASAI